MTKPRIGRQTICDQCHRPRGQDADQCDAQDAQLASEARVHELVAEHRPLFFDDVQYVELDGRLFAAREACTKAREDLPRIRAEYTRLIALRADNSALRDLVLDTFQAAFEVRHFVELMAEIRDRANRLSVPVAKVDPRGRAELLAEIQVLWTLLPTAAEREPIVDFVNNVSDDQTSAKPNYTARFASQRYLARLLAAITHEATSSADARGVTREST